MQIDNIGMKKGKGNFKSRRYPSDLALIRGTKFHSKPNYNLFESERLKEIKKLSGTQLLMSEMYMFYFIFLFGINLFYPIKLHLTRGKL